tara:strand:- start:65 stop:331 length:267 start_codon:yes stop_codon:yes gene_type:complete
MAVYCISYDLKSGNYDQLIESIKAYGIWWHQSESTWFIESTHGPRQIFDNLNKHLRKGDKIIVIKVHKSWWAGGHNEEEYQWLKNRNF